jgi:hypothetical protein
MVNAECIPNHPVEVMPMSDTYKDLISKYLEPSTATSEDQMLRVPKETCAQHTATDWPSYKHAKR